jgi:hypothetical protein
MPIAYPRRLFLAGLALLGLSPLTARIWTDSQGRTLEAELVSVTATAVNVRRADGRSLSLARAQLSAADQAFVDAAAAATPQATGTTADRVNAPATASAPGGGDFNEFNRLLGLPVLADGLLWDDEPAAVARQLKLTVEGKNAHFEGYRGYRKACSGPRR